METLYIVGIVIGVIILGGLLVLSIIKPLPCMIVKILINITRIIIVIIFIRSKVDVDSEPFVYFPIKMAIITGFLTLYSMGASVFQDTLHETGNILINPTDIGFKMTKEITGDTRFGNLVTALFISGVVAFVTWLLYTGVLLNLCEDFGTFWPPLIIFGVASIIGIVRSILSFIITR